MAEKLKNRNEMDPAYTWNLTGLYASDEVWENSLSAVDPLVEEAASFQGKLNNAENILSYLTLDTKLNRVISNLFEYANLRKCEDTADAEAQIMYQKAYGKYVQAVSTTAFALPEMLSMSVEELQKIVEDPILTEYRHNLEDLVSQKEHMLSVEQEMLLTRFAEVFAVPSEASENLMDADLVFEPARDSKRKRHEVSGSSYIQLQSSEDRVLRKNAFKSLYKGYKSHINTLTATYAGAVKAATTEASVRHYASSRQMAMSSDHIPEVVYDNLIEAVHRHMPAMHRYAALRKEILGLDELHYYDVYAPLAEGVEKEYTYEQAQEMILSALAPMGEDYTNTVREAFASRWIDVYPNKGKRGGAFSSGTYDSTPYILTNFTGTLDSVSTIAHEMGHSMHTHYATSNQPPQYGDYTLFVAEVASTVNENLLIEDLLSKTEDDRERLSLLNQYLENFKGTVYRQAMFAEFEAKAHAMQEAGEPLTAESLSSMYEALVQEYFGEALVMDEQVRYEWARIPHFYRPFYVYVYATGYSTAVALSEGIRKEGDAAVKRYIEFLSMGSSEYPLDELKHAGVDLNTPAPIDAALTKFETVLDEAEKIAERLKEANV